MSDTTKVAVKRVKTLSSWVVLLGILVVLLGGGCLWLYRHQHNPLAEEFKIRTSEVSAADRQAITQLIKDANTCEFGMYQSLAMPDTAALSGYFIANGPAYQKVMKSVMGNRKRKWKLNTAHDASYFEVLELQVMNTRNNVAEAVSRENWYLDYADSTGKSVYTYSELNTQYYQLKKTPEGWKIFLNHYPTTNVQLD